MAVPISFSFLQEWLTTGFRFNPAIYVKEGLPEGAKYVGEFISDRVFPHTVYFVFEHESFDEVDEGAMIPQKNIVFARDE